MKRIFLSFFGVLSIFCLFFISQSAFGQNPVKIPTSGELFERCQNSTDPKCVERWKDLPNYAIPLNPDTPSELTGAGQFQIRFVVERILDGLKRFLIPIGILVISVMGVKTMVSGTDESALEQAKTSIGGVALGFFVLLLGVNIVDFLIFGQEGEILTSMDLSDQFGQRIVQQMEAIFVWGSSFVGGVALLFLILGSLQVMTAGGDEAMSQAKNRVLLSLGGIFAVVVARNVFRIFTSQNGQIVVPNIQELITYSGGWFNFLLGIISFLSFISIILGGIRLLLSFGDESAQEAAQRMVIGSAIALVLSASVWTITAYLVDVFA